MIFFCYTLHMNILKIIDYGLKARQGYNAPDELLAETSFGFVEGFFIISFIILGLVSGGLLFFGFRLGYSLMVVFGVLFLFILVVDIILYRFLKSTIQKISTNVTNTVKRQISRNTTVDVEATEVK